MEAQVKIEFAKLQAQRIIAPVDPRGVMNASQVVWQRKKDGSFRLCASRKQYFTSWKDQSFMSRLTYHLLNVK